MKILVINGPNINMLGMREPHIYGEKTYADLIRLIQVHCERFCDVDFFQSNYEGKIVEQIQNSHNVYSGIILNAAAYTHTSIAIRDAISSVSTPVIEVHISDVDNREAFRKVNFIRDVCIKSISNEGFDGYLRAIDYLEGYVNDSKSKQ